MKKSFTTPVLAIALILLLSLAAVADTIRLKDGSVIRGQVIGFRDQQFVILVGQGARGRRSEVRVYMEDVESIEFDNNSAGGTNTGSIDDGGQSSTQNSRPNTSRPGTSGPGTGGGGGNTSTPRPASSSPNFFQINTRVRGDATTNGWTNTGLVVRRGQRIRRRRQRRLYLDRTQSRIHGPARRRPLPWRQRRQPQRQHWRLRRCYRSRSGQIRQK
ncbi:MAG: hypothetical protein LC731_06785 [Acidobacteria bacterium]|nr:hypothetical protein [Acidobacteriota bacterium]